MRIGFVTQLLWDRYGAFWTRLLAAAGAEIALPEREIVLERLEADPAVSAVNVTHFRLAAAQASAMSDCDALVVPRLNPESTSERGGAQDRWIADFPGALGDALPGLPELIAVPAEVNAGLDGVVAIVLSGMLHDPAAVERVWSRHKALVVGDRWRPRTAPGERDARAVGDGSGRSAGEVIGVICQPWLASDALAAAVAGVGATGASVLQANVVDARPLRPERLREVGRRFDERLIDTDAEVLGAARVLSGRSDVAGLVYVVDSASRSDSWLVRRVREHALKPVTEVALADLIEGGMPLDALLTVSVE